MHYHPRKPHLITMWLLRGQLFTLYGSVAKVGFKRKNVDIH